MKYCTGDVWVVELPWSERNGTANCTVWWVWLKLPLATNPTSPKPVSLDGRHDKAAYLGRYHAVVVLRDG